MMTNVYPNDPLANLVNQINLLISGEGSVDKHSLKATLEKVAYQHYGATASLVSRAIQNLTGKKGK